MAPVEHADPPGHGDSREVEVHEESLAVRAGDADPEDVWRPRAVLGRHHQVRHRGAKSVEEAVAEPLEPRGLRDLFTGRELRCAPERDGPGNVFGPWPDAELLAPTVDDRLDRLAVPYDEGADAFGAPILCPEIVSSVSCIDTRTLPNACTASV